MVELRQLTSDDLELEVWKGTRLAGLDASTMGRLRLASTGEIIEPLRCGNYFRVPSTGGWHNYVHRVILNIFCPRTPIIKKHYTCVDHINGESGDNRLSNLRWSNRDLNMMNKPALGYKRISRVKRGPGVYYTPRKQYTANLTFQRKRVKSPMRSTAVEAQEDYVRLRLALFRLFDPLNSHTHTRGQIINRLRKQLVKA